MTVVNQFFPEESNIQVHQLRVCPCLSYQLATIGRYGGRCHSSGKTPKWVRKLLSEDDTKDHEKEEQSGEENEDTEGEDYDEDIQGEVTEWLESSSYHQETGSVENR